MSLDSETQRVVGIYLAFKFRDTRGYHFELRRINGPIWPRFAIMGAQLCTLPIAEDIINSSYMYTR